MPRHRFRTHPTWLALVALTLASPATAQVTPSDWQVAAVEAHAGRDFAKRDAALRRLAQTRRHAAPLPENWGPADALNCYGEVVAQIHRRTGVAVGKLYDSGVAELAIALELPQFQNSHLADVDAARLRTVVARYAARRPGSAAEARELAFRLTRDCRAAGLRTPQAVALEFINGACAAVDPYTHFDLDPVASPAAGGGVAVVSGHVDHFQIRVDHFSDSTSRELAAALTQASQSGSDAVTLDLCGNPGGSLDAAARCAKLLGGDSAGATRFGELTTAGDRLWGGRIVIRVDAGTASAAELLAATLQEQGRAVVVGELTFGKGRVQAAPIPLSRGYLTVTIAELTTPGGVPIERRGVTPDATRVESLVAAR